jgi:thiol:disulfide interchange protein DsbD
VIWSAQLQPKDVRSGEGAQVVLTARIEKGWHLYSLTQPPGGSLPTSIELLPGAVLKSAGKPVQPTFIKKPNPAFKITDELYEKGVSFGIPVTVTGKSGKQSAKVKVRYMVCNEKTCLPPKTETINVAFTVSEGIARPDQLKPVTSIPTQEFSTTNAEISPAPTAQTPTTPAPTATAPDDIARRVNTAQSSGIFSFIFLALTMGFIALLTPCVFPMIPITVSFFTKQQEKEGGRGLRGPIAFCLGIIVTFTGIGLLISALFGASGITRFAANPWLNLTMAAVFVALALNLFGVFEIVVPPALLDRVQPKHNAGKGKPSLLAPVLMGLAFSLTSFTCTVPFVGTLLVSTAQGSPIWPALGMLAFSAAFAAPFFLLALFPQWLSKLPKSGGWLISVKAFMGFLELAAALKFLSTADYVWQLGWLTRPMFLSIWSTIFLIAGFYLLRWLRLPSDADSNTPGTLRRVLGVATIGAGIYLLAAISSAPLGALAAYPPPPEYGAPEGTHSSAITWLKDDYEGALAQAKQSNKPVLLDFTGYACTNCRQMELEVLTKPPIEKELNNFVTARLYTDGTDAKSQIQSKLQVEKFGTPALPLYVILSPEGKEIARFEGYDPNPDNFLNFLQRGGQRFAKK